MEVCLIYRPTFILLVLVEDKTLNNRTDAEAQVIAEAIAAFQFNNRKRKEHGLDPLDAMTIPAITMSGTRFLSLSPWSYHWPASRYSNSGLAVCHRSDPLTECQHWDGGYGVQKACFETFPRFQDAREKPLGAYFGGPLDDVFPCRISSEITIKGVNVVICLDFMNEFTKQMFIPMPIEAVSLWHFFSLIFVIRQVTIPSYRYERVSIPVDEFKKA
jgi:hypothetical protein